MRLRDSLWSVALLLFVSQTFAAPPVANRLARLDAPSDPYYVGLNFPKLITPQWIGEEGVEAAVVLAIDDMRDPAKYETYLRPILDRLKAIDGRAALSIMTCKVDPNDPRLRAWLKEGVSLEIHTIDHPCPLLQKSDFAAAGKTYHDCVDLLSQVPDNLPVAFRMPCCDSLNTVSPRFFDEIFNKTSPKGQFLAIDSSVFHLFTSNDPELPRSLVQDADGRERFRKYVPFPSFVNTIENYPYPYMIGGLCWEFPCMVPSDWEAQYLQKPNNPKTLEDMKAALDAVVYKQGVFNLVFHPHGWIKNEQIVELIDHAVWKHGKKVKFLSFREAHERLQQNLSPGIPFRTRAGTHNGVELVDINADGFIDVLTIRREQEPAGQAIWSPKERRWLRTALPTGKDNGNNTYELAYINLLEHPHRFLDIDGDGTDEWIVDQAESSVFRPDIKTRVKRLFGLPAGARLKDGQGRDAGLRFVDLDEDGALDVIFSNEKEFGVYLFESMEKGWSRKVIAGPREAPNAIPVISRSGTNNGFWVHSRHLWWQNEDTAKLPNLVDRLAFNTLLKDVEPRGKTPEAARRSIQVRDGFKVETVAQEPLVLDPIAFDWDADGRLWVVEMGDYPLGTDGKGKHGGVVRILEDTDEDGRYDKSTTFLEGLGFPSGLMPWRNGVLIACAPDIFYAEDRDGDGKADHREVLFTGFREGNQQHRLNGFEWGLDGWIYGANGDSGGSVRSLKTGKTVNIQGRDFRFRPDTGEFEPESGQTQYGRHRDDWGHWFGNNNPTFAWHYVLADADLRRNPSFALPDTRNRLEPDTRVYPISRTLPRFNDPNAANRVTSANSPTPYRDELFGPHFANSLFVSEPVHNLVHRIVLEPDGATFKGRRDGDETEREFLASSDNWFRPTMLKTGPDGALYVADMYRAVIEHPEWIPDDWEARLDLRAGSNQGRIYRVFPVDAKPRAIPKLSGKDTAELIAALKSPNGWERDTAQRLLIDRHDPEGVKGLVELTKSAASPKTRLQALWTLAGLDALDETTAKTALADPHPQVRRNALQASRPLLAKPATLADVIIPMADDSDPEVRFQVALSLGDVKDPRAGRALARLILRTPDDAWMRAAVLTSAPGHSGALLAGLFGEAKSGPPPSAVVEWLFALVGRQGGQADLKELTHILETPAGQGGRYAPWQFSALAGLLDTLDRSGKAREIRPALDRIDGIWSAARHAAEDDKAADDLRTSAIRLLGRTHSNVDEDRTRLEKLLNPKLSIDLQRAAISSLGRIPDRKTAEVLIAGWKGYSPALRESILDSLLSRDVSTAALLSSLEDKCTPLSDIGPAHRRRLLGQRDKTLRERAEALFTQSSGSRQSVVDAFRPALALKGDATAGAAVFKRACATCHRLKNEGTEVGPDLATLSDKSPESLLVAILDPNRAFEAKFALFNVALKDGRVLAGMIANETSVSLTLRRQEGKEDVLLRADIDELAASGQSLMPEGLEKDLKPQELADLIAFLGSTGPPPKQVEGNHPERVRPGVDGTIVLAAQTAEIYGNSLIFESKYKNLGYWQSSNDRAAWQFEVTHAGRYDVWLEWACENGTAGQKLMFEVAGQQIELKVAGTKDWDTYRSAKIGTVTLSQGPNRLGAHPEATLRGPLIDLRSVTLKPIATPNATVAPCCETP